MAGVVRYSGYSRAIAARIHRIRTPREGTPSSVFGIGTSIETDDSGILLAAAARSAACSGISGRGASHAAMMAPAATAPAAAAPNHRHGGMAASIRRMRDSRKETGSPNAATPTICGLRRRPTRRSSSPYAGADRPCASTRASQSISTARRKRRHCHHNARFHGATSTATSAAARSAGSAARTCSSSCASINSRSRSESSSAHSGNTTRGDHSPTTAGPTLGDTRTSRPSTAACRHCRRRAASRVAAVARASSMASDAMTHVQRSGRSRSLRERDRCEGWWRIVEVVTVELGCDSMT